MAYVITVDAGFAHLVFSQHLTVAEVVQAAQELDALDAGSESTPHRLVEIANVQHLVMNFSAMHAFTSKRREVRLKNKVRTAVVAASPVQYGVARMFQLLNSQTQTEVAVFHCADAARQWVLGQVEAEALAV